MGGGKGADALKASKARAKQTSREAIASAGVSRSEFAKFSRGGVQVNTKNVKSQALRARLENTQDNIAKAAAAAAASQVLLPSEAGFIELDPTEGGPTKVFQLKQKDLLPQLDLNTSRHAFDLQLHNFAPYFVNFSRNGRNLLFGGRRGHVATYDCHTMSVGMELQLQQEIFDVQYLHNETMFAVAQERHAYIYDQRGVEIHCLKRHERPLKLDYLPYHFLLCSVGHSGWIKWQDVSIGEYVAGYQTGHGPCRVLKQNPFNAVMNVGHANGVVTMWAPSAGKPLVSMFTHKGAVTDLAVDRQGTYMATTGMDGFLKIWDLRMMRSVHAYRLNKPATSIDISDRGLLAVGMGRNVQILKNAFTNPTDVTYMNHEIRTPNAALSGGGGVSAATKSLLSKVQVSSVRFRPLEDVLCMGHSHGVTSIIVPGSGEPNFDSFEANPFITVRQRREAEVQNLLNKLSPDMIGLETNFIGTVEKDVQTLQREHKELFDTANNVDKPTKEKNRSRGRNKISAKLKRKQKNVIDEQLVKLKEKQKEAREAAKHRQEKTQAESLGALSRFVSKN